eukprot:GHRQ01007145.1.p1 GENE.GHRQ01007145.1~~GHRQ01007145.1.p1  ORF type:complete len:352 (+),score=55.01 GHRQ01007145.1:356-1411(+)
MLQSPAPSTSSTAVALVLVLLLIHNCCVLGDPFSVEAAPWQRVTRTENFGPEQASEQASHSRQLLQNADQPALTPYGGILMEDMVPEGYPIEKHRVNTEDGWVLNMYRIPHGKYRNNKPGPRPVVLLHHGITLSSACWTLLNANESTAYILADAGFDVWMANTRGNTFSRGNYNYSYRDQEYWYQSIDEYALVDLPAQVNTALAKTGAPKLAIVGHSQGCTLVYAILAALPEMNAKVSVAVHLGESSLLSKSQVDGLLLCCCALPRLAKPAAAPGVLCFAAGHPPCCVWLLLQGLLCFFLCCLPCCMLLLHLHACSYFSPAVLWGCCCCRTCCVPGVHEGAPVESLCASAK